VTAAPVGIWIAVANSSEVGRDLIACEAAGRKLVLYRRQDQRPVALEDECWHRLLPLSNGRLDGDHVICAYHGLTFGPDGQCVRTRLGSPPEGARVRSYPAVDADGLVWIWAEGADTAVSGSVACEPVQVGSRRARLSTDC
jgi:phenylpropionate dioxygenase-like ring-hydroxylating dioxygenase large terminal subunit